MTKTRVEQVNLGTVGPTFAAYVDVKELAVRMVEALSGEPRLPGWTAEFAMDQLQANDAEAAKQVRLMANTAMLYFKECLQASARQQ